MSNTTREQPASRAAVTDVKIAPETRRNGSLELAESLELLATEEREEQERQEQERLSRLREMARFD